MKFVFISGGVLSGLGKGVTTASVGLLLKSRGIKVTAVKCDMYLNVDAGTMNPIEHGEVFVTHDGLETDQDLGHYERFLGQTLNSKNYMTNGLIYKVVLEKERALEYGGECVQPYHHLPPEIISRWYEAGKEHGAEVVLIELGGTVGEYEGLLFFESIRRLKLDRPDDVILIHVGYLPVPSSIGELKSKPVQQSVSLLNSLGIHPDIIVGRAEKEVDIKRKEKIALASGIPVEDVISNPDVETIYEVPVVLDRQSIATKIIRKLKIKGTSKKDLFKWNQMVLMGKKAKRKVKIGMVGKYQKTGDYTLEDSYVCVVEALKHAGWQFGVEANIDWVDSETLAQMSQEDVAQRLSKLDAIIVPQGWGKRGTEGKIKSARYARENSVPYLGLCFGMQMASIEFGRNVCGLKNANTQEVSPNAKHQIIHIMPSQKEFLKNRQYGGTIRLGGWPCHIKQGTKLEEAYKKYGDGKKAPWYMVNDEQTSEAKPKKGTLVYERHRHRYEFNNKYRDKFEKKGFVFSGTSPDGKLVEAIEIKDHPFFVGTQFHPEYISRPLTPHPIFMALFKAMVDDESRKTA
jgi:CTP synthase